MTNNIDSPTTSVPVAADEECRVVVDQHAISSSASIVVPVDDFETEQPKEQIPVNDEPEHDQDQATQHPLQGDDHVTPRNMLWLCCSCYCFNSRCMDHYAHNYPRLYAISFGIFIPLFSLVIITCLFGYWIAQVESPIEIQQNDDKIAKLSIINMKLSILSSLTSISPKVCLQLFLNNITTKDLLVSSSIIEILYLYDKQDITNTNYRNISSTDLYSLELLQDIQLRYNTIENETISDFNDLNYTINLSSNINNNTEVNLLELFAFFRTCGEKFYSYIYNYTDLTTDITSDIRTRSMNTVAGSSTSTTPTLTFNWNRCTPYSIRQPQYVESLRPWNQTKYYIYNWEMDAKQIYQYYYNTYTTTNNISSTLAMALARNQSNNQATGGMNCDVNIFAGAWFWFTIMSTIGYGNAAIETKLGRFLIYTFGFVSILLFGGLLLGAGAVTVAIFDDALIRCKVRILTRPWIGTIIWGLLYYTWMSVIANYYQDWNFERLGTNSTAFNDGYWFAYISTTTVGLGDFILEPSVLRGRDMVSWPCIFLFGFILFSAFICRLSSIVMKPMHDFSNRLKETGMIFGEARSSIIINRNENQYPLPDIDDTTSKRQKVDGMTKENIMQPIDTKDGDAI